MMDNMTLHVNGSLLNDEHRRLVEAARQHLEEAARENGTTKLEKDDTNALQMPHRGAFGLLVGDALNYQVLPKSQADEAERNPLLRRWRIELSGLGPNAAPIGLDICGDVVFGRGQASEGTDFDLTP